MTHESRNLCYTLVCEAIDRNVRLLDKARDARTTEHYEKEIIALQKTKTELLAGTVEKGQTAPSKGHYDPR